MNKLQRLLVPVDFSETSKKALEYAYALANRFDAKLDVLHVMVGSVAEKVVRLAPCPVLTYRTPAK